LRLPLQRLKQLNLLLLNQLQLNRPLNPLRLNLHLSLRSHNLQHRQPLKLQRLILLMKREVFGQLLIPSTANLTASLWAKFGQDCCSLTKPSANLKLGRLLLCFGEPL